MMIRMSDDHCAERGIVTLKQRNKMCSKKMTAELPTSVVSGEADARDGSLTRL